jgi:hypothetical protein
MGITCNAFVVKRVKRRDYRAFVCGRKAITVAVVTDPRSTPSSTSPGPPRSRSSGTARSCTPWTATARGTSGPKRTRVPCPNPPAPIAVAMATQKTTARKRTHDLTDHAHRHRPRT